MKKNALLVILSLSLLGTGTSFAMDAPHPPKAPLGSDVLPAPSWASLSAEEQRALASLGPQQFDRLTPQQRRKWKAFVPRYLKMSPEAQQRASSRMRDWARMTPEQRAAARQHALMYREKQSTQSRKDLWSRWRSLSDEEQRDLRSEALNQSQSQPKSRSH